MFGPFDPVLGSHIQSITDALDIPHLESRLDLEPQEKEFSINLFPSHVFLNQAYKDMIKFLKWKRVAIVYEEDIGEYKILNKGEEAKMVCKCIEEDLGSGKINK